MVVLFQARKDKGRVTAKYCFTSIYDISLLLFVSLVLLAKDLETISIKVNETITLGSYFKWPRMSGFSAHAAETPCGRA